MADDPTIHDHAPPAGMPRLAPEPALEQGEIDSLTGYRPDEARPPAGLSAAFDAVPPPREPMPMLDGVFERLVRNGSARLRTFFSADADLSLAGLASRRYGEVLDDLAVPAQVFVFRAEGWSGSGLLTVGNGLAFSVLDALLGGARTTPRAPAAPRPATAIEIGILTSFVSALLAEIEAAFAEVAPVKLVLERVETEPRIVEIARPSEAVLVATLRLDLAGRSGTLDLLVPVSTLEPVRHLLSGRFLGEKLGRDDLWSAHLATEIWQADLEAAAVLHEMRLPLGRVMNLAIGETLMFDTKPTDLVELRCGGLLLGRGRIGRVDGKIALQLAEPLRVSRPTHDSRSALRAERLAG